MSKFEEHNIQNERWLEDLILKAIQKDRKAHKIIFLKPSLYVDLIDKIIDMQKKVDDAKLISDKYCNEVRINIELQDQLKYAKELLRENNILWRY